MKNREYYKYLFEIIAIFIGISLSFWVENIRIVNLKQENLDASLELISDNLDKDISLLQENDSLYKKYISQMNSVLIEKTSNYDTTFNFLNDLHNGVYLHFNTSGYTILLEGDGIQILNKKLLSQITEYYNSTLSIYQVQIRETELPIMTEMREFLYVNLPYKSFVPKKAEYDYHKFQHFINEPTTYKHFRILMSIRITNQKHTLTTLADAKALSEEIKKYLE